MDAMLLGRIEAFLTMIIDQVQDKKEGEEEGEVGGEGEGKYFPEALEVYVKVALYEYRTFLAFYYEWEGGEGEGMDGDWGVGEGGRREFPKLMSFAAVKGYV